MKRIGFGIIGCGIIAPWHAKGIEAAEAAKLIAVSDLDEEKAREFGELNNVDYYKDYDEMLKRDDIDAVCICTPSSLHPAQAIGVARMGKHVLTEKPMAITLNGADEMIDVCRKNNVKLGVIFQRRMAGVYPRIKQAINRGELGKLILGDIYMKYYRSQQYYDSAQWRGTYEYDGGGALMNQGSHLIDLLQWFMGDVDTIFGYAETLARNIEVEDTSVAALRFTNGALGIIEGTTAVCPPIDHRLEIHGEKGTVMIEGERLKKWGLMDQNGDEIDMTKTDDEIAKFAKVEDTDPIAGHKSLIQDFVKAIRENREPFINGEEGRKSLRIILSIYESSRTRKPVKLR